MSGWLRLSCATEMGLKRQQARGGGSYWCCPVGRINVL